MSREGQPHAAGLRELCTMVIEGLIKMAVQAEYRAHIQGQVIQHGAVGQQLLHVVWGHADYALVQEQEHEHPKPLDYLLDLLLFFEGGQGKLT